MMGFEDEYSSGVFNLPETLKPEKVSSTFLHDHENENFMKPDPSVKAGKFPPAPLPLHKSFSYNMLNAKAQSFLPRNNSTSSLQNMSTVIGTPVMGPPSPLMLMGPPSPMMGPPSPMMGPPSPIWGSGSPMTLTGTTTTTTQKTSFVIPQRSGPPTLLHVFQTTTLPSPTSPGPTPLFATHVSPSGFHREVLLSPAGLAPQPLSPAMVAALSMPPPKGGSGKGAAAVGGQKSWPLDEVSRKVLHQVEFYFSDLNVATTDHLIKFMHKDPEGYVPLSVVASFKKIRSCTSSNAQLASILRNSEKLIVSDDGKRVKRVVHLTESYMEELQSRIVVAENLPRDHSHQTLMRIFSGVGSVNAIRTCQPSNAVAKSDGLFHSNKLHAFVEYKSLDLAEKAVVELTDKKNWRNGLKVRFLIRNQQVRSPARSMKSGSDNGSGAMSAEESEDDEDGDQKRARGRGWGKGRERPQYQPPNSRGIIMGSAPHVHISSSNEHNSTTKQAPRVPRMPDGTRGFSMGRGKMIAARTA